MKTVKKSLSFLVAFAVVVMSAMSLISANAEGETAAANVVDGQTVISREFLENIFEKPWQTEEGAVVSYENLDVAKNGDQSTQLLFAGEREEDEEGSRINSVAVANQKEGSITYKLSIKKETKELGVGMVFWTNTDKTIKVFVSDSETFGADPAVEFHGESDTYATGFKNVAINAGGDKTEVYVKIVLPYANISRSGWLETGINRLMLTPAVTKARHTTDTADESKSTNKPVILSDLTKAAATDTFDTWAYGMYGFSEIDAANHIYDIQFKQDSDGHPLCASQTFEGQWGYSPRTAYIIYKLNTVTPMEEAKVTANIRIANSSENDDAYSDAGDDLESFTISYSKDGVNWEEGTKKVGDNSGTEYKGDLSFTLGSDKLGTDTDTLYVRVEPHIVAWPDWAYMSSLQIETKGKNPTEVVPDDTSSQDDTSSDSNDPADDDTSSDDNTSSDNSTASDDTVVNNDNNYTGDELPKTGVAMGMGAVTLFIAAVGGMIISKKKK